MWEQHNNTFRCLSLKSSNLIRKWELKGSLNRPLLHSIERNIDSLVDEALAEVGLLADKYPDAAFAQLTRLVLFLNSVIIAKPSLGSQIAIRIYKLSCVLKTMGARFGAISYTIGVSSLGVYVDLTFPAD
jgi:hypothetical protein